IENMKSRVRRESHARFCGKVRVKFPCLTRLCPILNDTQTDNDLTKELYIFSGLGADERVFQRLDFSGFSATFIKWIVPKEKETIENYATRLLDQITTTNPTLIGLSFGGLIAVEVAKQIDTEKVILIASAKTRNEIPFYYRFAGQLGLHKLLPSRLLKSSNFITNWFFGIKTTFDKQLLNHILIDTDPAFLKWAIDKVASWTNQTQIKNIFHIHGTSDRILPLSFVRCNSTIKNGGHLMTLNKSDELNEILRQNL
ncbi:MAG: hypothetical protein ACK52X_06985, partial [bacterium]